MCSQTSQPPRLGGETRTSYEQAENLGVLCLSFKYFFGGGGGDVSHLCHFIFLSHFPPSFCTGTAISR